MPSSIQAGMDDYLHKSANVNDLLVKIASVLHIEKEAAIVSLSCF